MDAVAQHLHGSCACERNQYTILIPTSSVPSVSSQAQVYFDNSAANRRFQASPVTAWLRIPLKWYQSYTVAQFPDETHSSIRKTFHTTTSARGPNSSTRKQFCGYCGTHLTAWDEDAEGGYMNVTLGSLFNDSIEKLESLNLLADSDDDDEENLEDEDRDLSRVLDNQGDDVAEQMGDSALIRQARSPDARQMQHRGMPYFEEMIEHSRLGRVRRRKGGHTSSDGTTTVTWEITDIGGDDDDAIVETIQSDLRDTDPVIKRQRMS